MSSHDLQTWIENSWDNRASIDGTEAKAKLGNLLDLLESGEVRAAAPNGDGSFTVQVWVKKGILLYFSTHANAVIESGAFTYYDKVPLRSGDPAMGARFVPGAVVRRGAYIGKNVVVMPGMVNIGAYVGDGTMVDTWATVGSCAQIGAGVHLSGGVGIGGVLEPLQAVPVIIGDGAFIGSRCIVVEGVHVGAEAVLGANVVLTASTRIIDVSGPAPVEYKGMVPPRSVVIPGSLPKDFPAGTYQMPCALIIGQRKPSTDLKTSLNDVLRTFDVAV